MALHLEESIRQMKVGDQTVKNCKTLWFIIELKYTFFRKISCGVFKTNNVAVDYIYRFILKLSDVFVNWQMLQFLKVIG